MFAKGIISLFNKLLKIVCFYYDAFSLGTRWSCYQGFFPMLTFILFKKDMGEFTGMVYETIIYWKLQIESK